MSQICYTKHRGPDDSGIVCANTKLYNYTKPTLKIMKYLLMMWICFGFNRLSILDLSKNGHQPMLSPDQK